MNLDYCKDCQDYNEFDVENSNVDGMGYMALRCKDCHRRVAKCISCAKVYSIEGRNHTNIKKHMNECTVHCSSFQPGHNDEDEVEPAEDQSWLNPSINHHGENHSTSSNSFNSESSSILELDYNTANNDLNEYFTETNLSLVAATFPDFGNLISNTYFEQDYRMYDEFDEEFGGIRGICWRSRYRLNLLERRNISNLEDTEFMCDITKLLSLHTQSTNDLTYKVLNGVKDRTNGNFDGDNPDVRIPKSRTEADKSCLKGQFGIFNNLPCPITHNIGDHACMKLKDVLAHHLALGRRIQFTEAPCATADSGVKRIYEGIHGCQAMDDLIDNMKGYPNDVTDQDIYYAWLTTWSDSFLRSYVKQKHNNVWMYTITLPDPSGNATSALHTYCVAVGAGSLDHTSVIDWYANEVEELMKGSEFYCAFSKKIIYVKIGVVAALADRPEKAFTLKTSLLGVYGRIASWATDIDPDVLPDCNNCFLKRLDAVLQDRYSHTCIPMCNSCCQWDLNSVSEACKRVCVPTGYPTRSCINSPQVPVGREIGAKYLPPVQQTFQWLISAVNLAAHNVSAGVWNKGVMVAYLRTCSITTSVRDNLWTRCRPVGNRDVVEVVSDDGEIVDGFDPLLELDEENGVIPKIWKSELKMNAYIDCCMHLIFHGIVSYCVERVEEFMKTHQVTPDFEKLVNIYIIDIQGHRLEWCKVKTFPKSMWLAENELALARLIPFVYGLFFLNFKLPERLNTTALASVAIMQMFQSMFVMISILMSPRHPLAQMIEEHVKIFLSACHRYCRVYFVRTETPFWANTGNFPTLLCLAEQRRRFGPVRLYWEGTSERYIQELKQHLISMRRTTEYFEGKLRLMFKTNVMDWIRDEMSRASNDTATESMTRKPRMYYQYKSLDEVTRRVNSGEVLSGFTLKGGDEKIMIAYGPKRRSGFMNCISISRVNPGQSTKCIGLSYVKCQLDSQSDDLSNVDVGVVEEAIDHYCLMLPLINEGQFNGDFGLIYEDWDVGDEYFKKVLPSICNLLFDTNVMD